MAGTIRFLGHEFFDEDRAGALAVIDELASKPAYAYIVTPNVDHVVFLQCEADAKARTAYADAAVKLCDSRVLAGLARLTGRRLSIYPGSDLTRDLLERPGAGPARIAVLGPSHEALERVQARFPEADIRHLQADRRLDIGSPAWGETVERVAAAEWDILLVCLSFPKQEVFAHDLMLAGRGQGVAICVGAGIDFLSGVQHRAPVAMQRAGLEWFYRLASDPRRMWRRYLLRGPMILFLLSRQLLGDAKIREPL